MCSLNLIVTCYKVKWLRGSVLIQRKWRCVHLNGQWLWREWYSGRPLIISPQIKPGNRQLAPNLRAFPREIYSLVKNDQEAWKTHLNSKTWTSAKHEPRLPLWRKHADYYTVAFANLHLSKVLLIFFALKLCW